MRNDCVQAETLAGAIALGEATETERDIYRRHLAGCQPCIDAFGGEREIERVMATVALARDDERWEPDLRSAVRDRQRAKRRAWGFGFGAAAAALAASLGIHALVATSVAPLATVAQAPPMQSYGPIQHVTLERRPVATRLPAPAAAPQKVYVVQHNVVTLARPAVRVPRDQAPVLAKGGLAAAPQEIAAAIVPTAASQERTLAALRTTQSEAPAAERAESLAVAPVIRDVVPVGGETAIAPRPSQIAYDVGAEGTTAFEVSVNERGVPVKCTITKTSGYLVLDDAACKAAMRVHYAPRTVNGLPVPGVYRDAFTFRSSEE